MGRMQPWRARWTGIGSLMLPGGEYVVRLSTSVIDHPTQARRPVEIVLTADMARHVADRLARYADDVDRYNTSTPST
jgi:hypothetical protein